MLDARTKQTIDNACDTLVGRVPSPQTQVDIITTALIYKFMDDMDLDGLELSGKRTFFVGDLEPYAFSTVVNTNGNQERMNLYLTGLEKVQIAKSVPGLFRRIFKEANIPFRDPTTFALFLKEINELKYDDSEKIGDAFEYLLNKMSTAKNAGQFRTPRNIIDFIVSVVNPTKNDTILDPACGTAGFLISAYKHITSGERLTPDELKRVTSNIVGMDIDPTMVKLSLVNLYLHRFEQPNIYEYDTLSSDARWSERYDVILANPPFMTPKGGITPHNRFAIRANRSEVLFVDYFMEHLTINGRAGFVVPEGIIFQTANAYKDLRKMMLDGYLYAVVSLPSGVFNPYAGVKTSILFFDRAFAKTNDDILFVRVDNDGFSLGAQRTPIKQNDLPEALKIINDYREGKDVSGYERAMVVSKERIAENNYDLTAAKYIEKETRECKYEMVKLGDVCELLNGYAFKSELYTDTGIRVMRITNVQKGEIVDDNPKFYPFDKKAEIQNYLLYENDLLVSLTGNVGRVGLLSKDLLPAGLNQRVACLRPNTEKILLGYLFVILNQDKFEKDCIDSSGGIAQKNLSTVWLQNYEIPLPPLHVQQQIVDEIENKQSAINHAREIIKNLERERFYFTGLLDGIDCEEVKLGDKKYFNIESGGTPLTTNDEFWNGNIGWISLIDVTDDKGVNIIKNTAKTISEQGLKHSSAKILPVDTVVVSSRATIGRVGLTKIPLATNQGFKNIVILNKDDVDAKYIAYVMLQKKREIEQKASGGTFKEISKTNFAQLSVPLPSIEDQKRIVEKLEAEQEIIDANKRLIDLMQDKINQVINRIYKCDM